MNLPGKGTGVDCFNNSPSFCYKLFKRKCFFKFSYFTNNPLTIENEIGESIGIKSAKTTLFEINWALTKREKLFVTFRERQRTTISQRQYRLYIFFKKCKFSPHLFPHFRYLVTVELTRVDGDLECERSGTKRSSWLLCGRGQWTVGKPNGQTYVPLIIIDLEQGFFYKKMKWTSSATRWFATCVRFALI